MQNLKNLRVKIEKIDESIISLLALRLKVSKQVGHLKKVHHLPVQDKEREMDLIRKHQKISWQEGADPRLVQKVFGLVISHSRKIQKL